MGSSLYCKETKCKKFVRTMKISGKVVEGKVEGKQR